MNEFCPAPSKTDGVFDVHLRCNASRGTVEVLGPLEMKPAMIMALSTAIQVVINHNPHVEQNGNGVHKD